MAELSDIMMYVAQLKREEREEERDKALIDLTAQPDWVKEKLDQAISTQVQQATRPQIGIHLMKFCGKFGLNRIGESATQHVDYLTKSYAS